MKTLTLWTYDAWGNDLDGWDVNDRRKIQTEEIENDLPPDLVGCEQELARIFVFGPQTRIDWTASGDGVYELVNSQTGKPLGQIEVA